MSESPNPGRDLTGPYAPSTPTVPGERFAPGAVLAGRYRVVAPLGRGGMGEVYRADDLALGQPVALKFLPPHFADDPDRLARFRKEVAAARQVTHPNVCRVHDIAEDAGQTFLTMEFVDGEDLGSLLKRVGRLPEEKGVEVARQLCAALAAVHDQGLVHRDLKPANVMLDGRGKVRLTDFGLAATERSGSDERAGTPAYMAPEQAAGREVSARSDLFGLGLVLYELFTGRRAYPGRDRDGPPSKPTSHVTGLDPTVERVILRCLETDPSDRPRSAYEVLAGLPGGDPLAAAVAAGETPSPRLVADAPIEGTLRPPVAAGMFAATVAGLLSIAVLNDRIKAHRHVPLPPPAVLEEKARTLARDLGYTDPPADTVGGFEMPAEHQYYMAQHGSQPAATREQMPLCRPPLAVYWHRLSPRALAPVSYDDNPTRTNRLSSANPPMDVPGMVRVRIDTRGRLVDFLAVPDPAAAGPPAAVGWEALLRAAELDAAGVLRPDPAATPTPPVYADRTAAWDGVYPDRPDLAVRVEAASYRGRPVYFHINHPDWGEPPRDRPVPILDVPAIYLAVLDTIFGVFTATVAIVAVWNVRRGRADLRGVLVLAVTIITLQMLFWLLAGGHFSHPGLVFALFVNEFGMDLFAAGLAAVSYLALEPLIRRQRPHRLTAWSRLAAGRWRDPLVGRDVLIGVLAGVACTLDYTAMPFWPSRLGPTVVHPYAFTHPVGSLAGNASGAVGMMWFYAGVFAVLHAIGRREWVPVVVLYAFFLVGISFGSGFPLLNQVAMAVHVAVALFLLMKFGILAAIAMSFTAQTVMGSPFSLDPSTWYFGASLTYLLVLAGLAAYGAIVSLGGRPLFGAGGLLGED
jgi:eukaryotic-like serine/threonine-protein kinase